MKGDCKYFWLFIKSTIEFIKNFFTPSLSFLVVLSLSLSLYLSISLTLPLKIITFFLEKQSLKSNFLISLFLYHSKFLSQNIHQMQIIFTYKRERGRERERREREKIEKEKREREKREEREK